MSLCMLKPNFDIFIFGLLLRETTQSHDDCLNFCCLERELRATVTVWHMAHMEGGTPHNECALRPEACTVGADHPYK